MTNRCETIYFSVTCDIITPGHVRCFQYLRSKCDFLLVGLLTDEALKGYKKNVVPYEDRKEILEAMYYVSEVVPQHSLSPEENIRKYGAEGISSGDGWEPEEKEVIKKYKLKVFKIPFPKKYSSTKIKKKICQKKYS